MQQKEHTEKKQLSKTMSRSLLLIGIVCFSSAALLSFQLANRIHHTEFPIPRETSVNQLESWMTIRYISHVYHIPEQVFRQKLSLTPTQVKSASLDKIAQQKNMDVHTLIEEIKHILVESSPAQSGPHLQTN